MKRFTTLAAVFGVSILAVWMIFQSLTVPQPANKNDKATLKLPPAHNEIMKAVNSGNAVVIPVTGAEARKIAPVYDSTGAVMSDPSGIVSAQNSANQKGTGMEIAPVFDSTGHVVSDPSGTIMNVSNP